MPLAGSIVEIKEGSSLKMKFDCGLNDEGKTIVKSRTYSNVKADAVALDVYNVAQTLQSLQKHTLMSVVKQDNTNLSA
jgi:hypothetical protein